MDMILTSIAGASTTIAVGAVVYRVLRPRFPLTVNCWFCNENTQVPYGNKNCWDCPNCNQYNGFTQDGDYNKPIPSQFSEDLNHPVSSLYKSQQSLEPASNGLCELCNRNQILKVRQLADFVPENEVSYELEVEHYKAYLDNVYGLCRRCELNVSDTIKKQDRILENKLEGYLQTRIQQADVSASDSVCSEHVQRLIATPRHVNLLRMLATTCSILLFLASISTLLQDSHLVWRLEHHLPMIICDSLEWFYTLAIFIITVGLLANMVAIYLAGKHMLQVSDAMVTFLWLAQLMLHSSPVAMVMDYHEVYLLQSGAGFLSALLSIWCVLVPRFENVTSTRITKRRYANLDSSRVTSTSGTSDNSPTADHQIQKLSPRENNPCLDKLETMSIGSVRKSRVTPKPPRAFAPFASSDAVPMETSPSRSSNIDVLHTLHRRPVISPARFQPSNPWAPASAAPRQGFRAQGASRAPPPGVSMGWTSLSSISATSRYHSSLSAYISQGALLPEDRASLFSEPRAPTADDSSCSSSVESSQSSASQSQLCPVDTTTRGSTVSQASCKKRNLIAQLLWGISIGANISVLCYFLLDYKLLHEYWKKWTMR